MKFNLPKNRTRVADQLNVIVGLLVPQTLDVEEIIMTVKELIKFLQKQPQDIQVALCQYSEQRLLEVGDMEVVELCAARDDGWVQNSRPDRGTHSYLLFLGN